MKLGELLDRLDSLRGVDREMIRPLARHLSPLSIRTVAHFQRDWFVEHPTCTDKSFRQFSVAQNRVIQTCVELEMSELGREARDLSGLEPLTLETELSGL